MIIVQKYKLQVMKYSRLKVANAMFKNKKYIDNGSGLRVRLIKFCEKNSHSFTKYETIKYYSPFILCLSSFLRKVIDNNFCRK